MFMFCEFLWTPGFSTAGEQNTDAEEGSTITRHGSVPGTLVRWILPVWEVLVLEIFKKLVVVVNLKGMTSSMHFISQVIFFAFVGGNTFIEYYLSNICVEY